MTAPDLAIPTFQEIARARRALTPYLQLTPVHRWRGPTIDECVGPQTEVFLKLELLQWTGTFKARGVLANLLALPREQLARGVTAVSAGNHAVAVAWGAALFRCPATVVMLATANPARVRAAAAHGATVRMAPDGETAFAMAEEIAANEGRTMIHPFDGRQTALGTATLGAEWSEQCPALEAVIVAIGGGGLAGGVATALKQLQPGCTVYGVEPEGANVMQRSFVAGAPQRMATVRTIADSLAPPMTLSYPYALCRAAVDEIVTVSDDELRGAMRALYNDTKLAVEPAGAAAAAALLYRLKDAVQGRRVGVLVCGSNIDVDSFAALVRT